ncbi:MAG: hypothetical protein KY468_02875 [Armatimonadetes bacterium]|nr:hypothetical protein [Armatimonadota bacterium]
MSLQREGERLTGSYTYVRNGNRLTLRGRVTSTVGGVLPGTEFEMDEYDVKGRKSGTFRGHFTSSETIRGSWWKTERPQRPLTFSLRAADEKKGPFSGSWNFEQGGYTFSLDLAQRGTRLDGSYCAITAKATRVDCISPVSGTVNGNTAQIRWTSAYGGGNGTAILTRQGSRLRWVIQQRPESAFHAPPEATLRRDTRG